MSIIPSPMKASPSTIDELLERAEALAGLTLGELAQSENIRVPNDFKREKGWSGQLLELALGAEAGSKAQQDFANIGVVISNLITN